MCWLNQPKPRRKPLLAFICLKPQIGTVLACGDAAFDDGQEIEFPVKKGQEVIYKKWGGNDFEVGETEYQFLKFEDLLAVVSKK